MAHQDHITEGWVAVCTAVEPGWSYSVRGDRQSKEIHLVLETRQCLHLYYYYQHPDFGRMQGRVPTWFPFTVDVCLKGREWRARQMDRAGLKDVQRDNCFTWVEDPAKAQSLLDRQEHTDWRQWLDGWLEKAPPVAPGSASPCPNPIMGALRRPHTNGGLTRKSSRE